MSLLASTHGTGEVRTPAAFARNEHGLPRVVRSMDAVAHPTARTCGSHDEETSRGQRPTAASAGRCRSRPGPGPRRRRDGRPRLVLRQSGSGSERRGDVVLAQPRPPRRSASARAARLDDRSNRQCPRRRAVAPAQEEASGSRPATGLRWPRLTASGDGRRFCFVADTGLVAALPLSLSDRPNGKSDCRRHGARRDRSFVQAAVSAG